VPKGSRAWDMVMDNALGAADTLSKKELKAYIEEYLDTLPSSYWH
jgi:hypothetical protein